MTFLGFDFAGYFERHLGHRMAAATYHRVVKGTRTAGAASSGTNTTSTAYACRGYAEAYDGSKVDGKTIRTGDRKIVLLARTIARGALVPRVNDRVTIGGVEYVLVGEVKTDPAGATHECQGRA